MKALESYLARHLPPPLSPLAALALDLQWTWHHSGDAIWRTMDPALWHSTRNAWLVLHSISDEHLEQLAGDAEFLALVQQQLDEYAAQQAQKTWFETEYRGTPFGTVAFFSMEFGITESLPIYSGGLGVLAGDLLKSAHDLGVPVVAVGLFYQQGYFHQSITSTGRQLEFFPYNDPSMLPLSPLRDDAGQWIHITVEFPGRPVRLRAWQATVGRCRLLLLDSNDPRNDPGDRGITSELYGGDDEKRLEQELLLGIGGWRLLEAAGFEASVCHMNEGHTGFAALERLRRYREVHQTSFEAARVATRIGNIFTTHTPLPAGFDRFPVDLVRKYLSGLTEPLGLSLDDLIRLGQPAQGSDGIFNMAFLSLRLAGAVTCVSKLHQTVSREILRPVFPRWPDDEVPILAITNGVHTPSWDSPEADDLWTRQCGKHRWCHTMVGLDEAIQTVDDHALWQLRVKNRSRLLTFVRERLRQQGGRQGASMDTGDRLEDDVLTLGFARRFTAYKRPDLLLTDPDRFAAMLSQPTRPVQLILSGKAHPKDIDGKERLARWHAFMQREDVAGRVIFLEDYDLRIAEMMVQGVDVWINTPRTSWEACGTSGMKVLVNGGLNLSQLDGWWAEAWSPEVGWGIGAEHIADDALDAEALYTCLENDAIPRFYDQDMEGLPRQWLATMRASMATLTAEYSANRMLREYVFLCYERAGRRLAELNRVGVAEVAGWLEGLTRQWPSIRFGNLAINEGPAGDRFVVQVHLGLMSPDWVQVELYAHADDGGSITCTMERSAELVGSVGAYNYVCDVPSVRPVNDFTPRIVPRDPHGVLEAPLEVGLILWYR
ncbi:alpha-glucan family phosphorylase [Marinobacter halodurans]|uniref:Alpha-glucan family phosphorylase n=1 Tax=Marinobacter halodurans TaxID=2528979 RepID=A0ABY1ZSS5_9GAMM|nr:alpha-glucan family phosphorylase [Marinobacter halodurans]TBW59515.1 alpha-glucan family phosphorylase [Marinobacter halodurans]